jgi:hypothetical protein
VEGLPRQIHVLRESKSPESRELLKAKWRLRRHPPEQIEA